MIAIINGKIIPVTSEPIEKGTVLIEDEKIKAVGSGIAVPEGAEIVDAAGKWVLPGLIDAHSHIALYGEPSIWANLDVNEMTAPNTAQLRAIDALNPDDPAFADVLAAGITSVYTGPGSANVIGGTGLLIKTYGRTPEGW